MCCSASIPWMGPLLQLIQEDRGGIDRRANTLASQLVADISRDIFDDERGLTCACICCCKQYHVSRVCTGDQRSKRQQDIEEMAIRRMDKDFFESTLFCLKMCIVLLLLCTLAHRVPAEGCAASTAQRLVHPYGNLHW